MNFKYLLILFLFLMNCETALPEENTLLDHSAKIEIYDFKNDNYQLIYNAYNFRNQMNVSQSEDTLIFTMKEFEAGTYLGVSHHIIRFEMADNIELPKIIDLNVQLDYTITNSDTNHRDHDIQGVNFEFRKLDESQWNYVNETNVDTLIASVLPFKFRATIDVYSAIPIFDPNRSYKNTSKLKITKFWLYGRH